MARAKQAGEQKRGAALTEHLAASERREQADLVRSGTAKLAAKQPLTSREKSAIKAYENEQLEKYGAQFVSAVTKSEYCDQVGIAQKVALEQSRRFGLPYHLSGKTINLWEQLKAWHAWAAENKHAITRVIRSRRQERDEELEDGDEVFDYWDTRRVKALALLKEQDLQERLGRMQPIEVIHDFLQEFYVAALLRRIELLEKRETPAATELADGLRSDIQEFNEALDSIFGSNNQQGTDPTAEENSAA